MQGQGSGVIIRKNGYIITNRHVVENAVRIEVRLLDGRAFTATVRGVDPQSDIAVIKIETDNLPVGTFADSSKTRVGEFAIAIGAPFNLDHSVTFGHVSAKSRGNVIPAFMGGQAMDQDFIQTDANINPGNSGGPLVNIDGEIIGINTLIRGPRSGIGFAVPSNLAKEVADKLIEDGHFARAWLGIGIQALREATDFQPFAPGLRDGVVVQSIVPNSPASRSELQPADVITSVNGTPVATPQQLRDSVRTTGIGQTASLAVYRNGAALQLKIQPGEFTSGTAERENLRRTRPAPAATGWGLTASALTQDRADEFGLKKRPGVIVISVDKNGPAARNGLQPGEIIIAVNGKPITTPEQFSAEAQKADAKKGLLLNLLSGDVARYTILTQNSE